MDIKTVNRHLIAATMAAVATLPSLASAGPSDSVVEGRFNSNTGTKYDIAFSITA